MRALPESPAEGLAPGARLWGGFDVPSGGFAGTFDVGCWMFDVLRWLCPPFHRSRFEVQGSKFGVSHKHPESDSSPSLPSSWSGTNLDMPYTHGTSAQRPFRSSQLMHQPFLQSRVVFPIVANHLEPRRLSMSRKLSTSSSSLVPAEYNAGVPRQLR